MGISSPNTKLITKNPKWYIMNELRKKDDTIATIFERLTSIYSISLEDLKRDYDTRYYETEENLKISRPDCYDLYPEMYKDELENKKKFSSYVIPRPYVSEVNDVRFIGSFPIPFKSKKPIQPGYIKSKIGMVNIEKSVRNFINNPEIKSADYEAPEHNYILLHNGWSSNYFHWMMDDLLRLQFIDYTPFEIEDIKLIVPPDLLSWQRESLELLGFNESNLLKWNYNLMHVNRLIIPSYRRQGITSKNALMWLKNKIIQSLNGSNNFSNKVYISRADASRRRVLNESEVMGLLSRFGFEKYVMSDLSVREQAELFNQASVVVSPHGANLTNIIFSDGCKLLSLFSENVLDEAFFVLSQLMGSEFHCMICDTYGPDIKVDLDELETRLMYLLD